MKRNRRWQPAAINTGSMADIAFLLLIFFLITTTIVQDKGLMLVLPPYIEVPDQARLKERNVFNVLINSAGSYLVEGKERETLDGLEEEIKMFLLNRGKDAALSESPLVAIVSFKTSRRTTHRQYIEVLDVLFTGYYLAQAEVVNMNMDGFRKLHPKIATDKKVLDRARTQVPRRLSIAEMN